MPKEVKEKDAKDETIETLESVKARAYGAGNALLVEVIDALIKERQPADVKAEPEKTDPKK